MPSNFRMSDSVYPDQTRYCAALIWLYTICSCPSVCLSVQILRVNKACIVCISKTVMQVDLSFPWAHMSSSTFLLMLGPYDVHLSSAI